MADDDLDIFDPNLQKKKKKKRTTFDSDVLGGEEEVKSESAAPELDISSKTSEDKAGLDVDGDFMSLGKKKKKKKGTDLSEALQEMSLAESAPTESSEAQADDEAQGEQNEGEMDFRLPLKKPPKKKKKKKKKAAALNEDQDELEEGGESGVGVSGSQTWGDTDRDYTYDELFKRVFDIMREKNPDMIAGEKKRFVMKPPQVMRIGTKKSSLANFAEICKMLHRQPKHLLAFLLAELGTSGSLDANSQLIIKGRFQQKQIETVLRGYIKEYVTCHTCRSPDTILQKDTRLYFLQCETCGSRCSVTSIKSGFQAVTSKRAAIRAKTT